MFLSYPLYLPLLISLAAGVIAVPLCIRLAHMAKIVDAPAHRKIHSRVVPYLGGLAIILGMSAGVVGGLWSWPALGPHSFAKMGAIGGCTLAATLLGLLDDKFRLRPRYKFFGQVGIAVFYSLFCYRFELIVMPTFVLDIQILSVPVTIFWMVAMINAFNMIDGIDGLAGSISLTGMAMLVVFAAYNFEPGVGLLALAGFGSVCAFLLFNWSPAKIFMGDAGSLGLGTFFATALLAVGNEGPFGLPELSGQPHETLAKVTVPFKIISVTLVMIYPAMEVLFSVVRRLLRGKPISSADKGHLHHRLLARGWKPAWICLAAVIMTCLAQSVVMAAMVHYLGLAAWLLGLFCACLGLSMHYLGLFEVFNPLVVRYFRPHYLIANHLISMQRLKLTLARSGDQVLSMVNWTCRELGVLRYTLVYTTVPNQSTVQRDWSNPDEEARKLPDAHGIALAPSPEGFTDRVRLAESGAEAVWTFRAIDREEELDIEYRVLMNSFMQDALGRLIALPPTLNDPVRRKSAVLDIATSASKLRERFPLHPDAPVDESEGDPLPIAINQAGSQP